MNSKSLMFLAAGNLPAALYHDRKVRRRSCIKMDDAVVASASHDPEAIEHDKREASLVPLQLHIPNKNQKDKIIQWLYEAELKYLATCVLGIATFGNWVCWTDKVVVERGEENGEKILSFTGRFDNPPPGRRFGRLVLTTSSGEEIAQKVMEYPITTTKEIVAVTAVYKLRFI